MLADACYSNPCSNGGHCTSINNGPGTYNYTCRCAPNYTGKQCQTSKFKHIAYNTFFIIKTNANFKVIIK